MATKTPLTIAYFYERQLHLHIKARLANGKFDAVLVYSSSMAQYVEDLEDTPRIMQFADLDSLKWQQYAKRSTLWMRWIYTLEAKRLIQYERRIAQTFDHSLVCTTREHDDFKRLIPQAEVSCVANGVDLDYFKPAEYRKVKNSLIFIGVMDYFPNIDGVVWFCHEIFPRIRAQIPDTTFTICGSKPVGRVRGVGKTSRGFCHWMGARCSAIYGSNKSLCRSAADG